MNTPRILIVDDSKAQRFIVRRSLEGQAVEIVGEAADGAEGVEMYEALRPDIVLLDLVMPVMDGQAALDRILAIDPGARVVISSSVGSEETLRECLERGARSYLQKPYTADVLARVVSDVMASVPVEA